VRAALLLLAACSVPDVSLEGKQCPCADGYVCDTPTNRCFPSNGDGGIIDSLATTSCLGGSTTEIYRYAGMFDWVRTGSTWVGGPEIKQTASNVDDSYTFKTTSTANDYRVIATMRPIREGNAPAYGIVLRAQTSLQDRSRYACTFLPRLKELRLESTKAGNTTTIGTIVVPTASATAPLTMEARVVGTTLACCLREYPIAKLTATNADTASGYPGLQTNRMEAAFGSFAVTQP
jgi:hypothetical protein